MECEEVLAEIEHYLHGELDPDRAAHLAEHLASCSPCFERAEFQRRFKEIVRSKCRSAPPEHLVLRVRSAIRAERIEFRRPPGSAT
jgi:mycothiol system anti-sigma-R factor